MVCFLQDMVACIKNSFSLSENLHGRLASFNMEYENHRFFVDLK